MRYSALGAVFCTFLLAAGEKLLFDFRGSNVQTAPPIAPEARQNLLSAAFPHYLADEKECQAQEPPSEATLEAARKKGQIVPEVMSRVAGAFIRPGAREQAYLIKVGECSAPSRSYFGTYRLAVFENRLIASGPSSGGDHIDAVKDVDGDGVDEILISGCAFGQGVEECSARLLSLAGGPVRTVQDFPEVYSDTCGSTRDSGIRASVIRFAPGHPPEFFAEEYQAACPKPGQKPKFEFSAERRF